MPTAPGRRELQTILPLRRRAQSTAPNSGIKPWDWTVKLVELDQPVRQKANDIPDRSEAFPRRRRGRSQSWPKDCDQQLRRWLMAPESDKSVQYRWYPTPGRKSQSGFTHQSPEQVFLVRRARCFV